MLFEFISISPFAKDLTQSNHILIDLAGARVFFNTCEREVHILQWWDEANIYEKVGEKTAY